MCSYSLGGVSNIVTSSLGAQHPEIRTMGISDEILKRAPTRPEVVSLVSLDTVSETAISVYYYYSYYKS